MCYGDISYGTDGYNSGRGSRKKKERSKNGLNRNSLSKNRRDDMREIEFRGKDLDGKWITGHGYAHIDFSYYVFDDEHINGIPMPKGLTMVDPETVGQYTGLKDKNGVKIFEGDIVLRINVESTGIENRIKSLITFEKGCFMISRVEPWPWKNPGHSLYDDYQCLTKFDGYLEVIGNIHGTPELLGGRE
jgi:uncharacterized phage protein (TIGR01671 family)